MSFWWFVSGCLFQFSSSVISLSCGELTQIFLNPFSAGDPGLIQVPHQMKSHETWNLSWDKWDIVHAFFFSVLLGQMRNSSGPYYVSQPCWFAWNGFMIVENDKVGPWRCMAAFWFCTLTFLTGAQWCPSGTNS